LRKILTSLSIVLILCSTSSILTPSARACPLFVQENAVFITNMEVISLTHTFHFDDSGKPWLVINSTETSFDLMIKFYLNGSSSAAFIKVLYYENETAVWEVHKISQPYIQLTEGWNTLLATLPSPSKPGVYTARVVGVAGHRDNDGISPWQPVVDESFGAHTEDWNVAFGDGYFVGRIAEELSWNEYEVAYQFGIKVCYYEGENPFIHSLSLTPSKTTLAPGETFTLTVRYYRTVYCPSDYFKIFYKNEATGEITEAGRWAAGYWQMVPYGWQTFTITLTAPSASGAYTIKAVGCSGHGVWPHYFDVRWDIARSDGGFVGHKPEELSWTFNEIAAELSISVGVRVNLGIVPINTADRTITQTRSYYRDIGEKLRSYFLEVSYNTLYVEFDVYNKSDGTWFSVPQTIGWYRTRSITEFINDAIDSCDDIVDFRKYDYHEAYGKGVIAFITAEDIWGAFMSSTEGLGYYNTDDGVRIDVIYVPEPRFGGEAKVIRGLAHEFGHSLGKILTTSVTGSSKDCSWILPDLYLRGNIDKHWDLMGDLRSQFNIERVHLSSYSKEWLGWLKYKETRKGETYTVKSLVTMKYGDNILIYSYRKPWWEAPHFYIMELRTNSSRYSSWDIQTLHTRVLAFYQVDVKSDFPLCTPDTIDLSRTLTSPSSFSDPDIGVTFKLITITEESAVVSIEEYKGRSLKGASITTSANVLSSVISILPHEAITLIPFPDIDLHAYSEDGKHVGMNYETGEYEIEIPGAIASGDLFNGREWIFVPEDINVHFVVSSRDNQEFLSAFQEAKALTNGTDTYTISLVYYDPDGIRYESFPLIQQIPSGEVMEHPYDITRNPDGTYTVTIYKGHTHAVNIDVKPESEKIVNRGTLSIHTNLTATSGNITKFTLQYQFNNTQIISYKPFGKIAYELYDEKGNLIEEGNLGDFNSAVFSINKFVLEGYTIIIKVHFEIRVLKNGIEKITIQSKIGAVTKSAYDVFVVEIRPTLNYFEPPFF